MSILYFLSTAIYKNIVVAGDVNSFLIDVHNVIVQFEKLVISEYTVMFRILVKSYDEMSIALVFILLVMIHIIIYIIRIRLRNND